MGKEHRSSWLTPGPNSVPPASKPDVQVVAFRPVAPIGQLALALRRDPRDNRGEMSMHRGRDLSSNHAALGGDLPLGEAVRA